MTQEKAAARKADESKETTEESKETEETKETDVVAKESDDQTTEDESKDESDEESQQLKAELEKERKARKEAETAAADKAFKLRELKEKKRGESEEREVQDDEEQPLTRKDLERIRAEEREATRKEMLSFEANRIASQLASSDTEKEVILEKWKNRSFPAHLSLEDQLEECYVITHRKKLLGERNEALRALKGKQGVNRDASGTHHDAQTGNQPKLAPADAAELARLGFKWNGTNRRYEKKLANGSWLVREKSGSTRLIKA